MKIKKMINIKRKNLITFFLITGAMCIAGAEEKSLEEENKDISFEMPETGPGNETGVSCIYKPYQERNSTSSRKKKTTKDLQKARKGYIGIGVGGTVAFDLKYNTENNIEEQVAFDLKKHLKNNIGKQVTVNFGYLFTRRVGIATSLIFSEYESYYYGTSGFVTGPLFSFGPAKGNFSFDLRPGIGFAKAVDSYKGDRGFIYDIGSSLRLGLIRYVSISLNLDYYKGPGTPALGASLGMNYRLK
jgi:hypothetical protein